MGGRVRVIRPKAMAEWVAQNARAGSEAEGGGPKLVGAGVAEGLRAPGLVPLIAMGAAEGLGHVVVGRAARGDGVGPRLAAVVLQGAQLSRGVHRVVLEEVQ